MNEPPKYLCEQCNARFNDLSEHIFSDNHAGSDPLDVECYGLDVSTGQFGYSLIRFKTTFNEIRKKIIKGLSVEVDSNHTLVDNDEPLKKDNTNDLSEDDNFLDITLPAETVLTNPEDKQLYEELMYLLHATVTSLNE